MLRNGLAAIAALGSIVLSFASTGCNCPPKRAEPRPAAAPAPCPQPWPTHRGSAGGMVWTTMAYPTGDPRTSALGLEKSMPPEVRVGQPFTFEMIITNLTNNALNDIVVSDECTAEFRLQSSTPEATPAPGGILRWMIGSLKACESRTIKVTGVQTVEGDLRSCTSVEYNSLLCATTSATAPKIQLTKSGPAQALSCEDIVYRFEIKNAGSGTARGLVITDNLPTGLVAENGSRTIRHEVGNLAAGQSRSFSSRVKATSSGRHVNKAGAQGEGISIESNEVATVVTQPSLTVDVTCPQKQYVGRPANIEITVTNSGDASCDNTVLSAPLAGSASFVSASDGGREAGGRVQWNLGAIPARGSKKVSMMLTASAGGALNASATANCTCSAPATDNCSVAYEGIAAILLEVVDVEDPMEVGGTVTYVITATNQGSADDSNIRIAATLEGDFQEHVSNDGVTQGRVEGNKVVFAPLPNLPAQRKATWRVIVKAKKAGDVRFAVEMNTDRIERPVNETEATHLY